MKPPRPSATKVGTGRSGGVSVFRIKIRFEIICDFKKCKSRNFAIVQNEKTENLKINPQFQARRKSPRSGG